MHHTNQITIVGESCAVGGTEQSLLNLARGLSAAGLSVRVAMPDPGSQQTKDWVTSIFSSVEFCNIKLEPGLGTYVQMHDILRELGCGNQTAINFHSCSNWIDHQSIAAIKAVHPGRLITTVHHIGSFNDKLLFDTSSTTVSDGNFHDVSSNSRSGVYSCVSQVNDDECWHGTPLRQLAYSTALGALMSDAVVVTSPMKQRQFINMGLSSDKIKLIPLGLVPPASTIDRAQARRILNIPPASFVILNVARQIPAKGTDLIIRAAAELSDPNQDLLVCIVGDGSAKSDFEQLANEVIPGRAVFPGFVNDVDIWYAASDIFVMVSSEEGFGQTYIEAAFHGLPSVGASVGGVPFAIEHGVTGLLVEPNSVHATSLAIKKLWQDREIRVQLGQNARKRAIDMFSVDSMIAGYLKILRSDNC